MNQNNKKPEYDTEQCSTVDGTLTAFKTFMDNLPDNKKPSDRAMRAAHPIVSTVRQCLCGCGTEIPHQNKYAHGHNGRGKKHSVEWCANKAEGLKSAWSDKLKFKTMRNQSPELVRKRLAKFGGTMKGLAAATRTPEVLAKISASLTGRKLSEDHIKKSSKGWLKGPQYLSLESQQKRNKSISNSRTGTHGFGRSARDNPQHNRALYWIIRDPRGATHEFNNLSSWCRNNEWRFLPDDRPQSKLKLWQRAISGFNGMQRTDKKGQHHWKGWTLVSVMERKQQGAPDLLARNEITEKALREAGE